LKTDKPNSHRRQIESFHTIFQNLEDFAIFTLDYEGRITSWNAGAKRIFGYTEEEIVGRDLETIFTCEDVESGGPETELASARENGRADDERWHKRKNGELFWASGILSAVKNENGDPVGFVKVIRDLTERKRAEEQRDRLLRELKEANRQLEEANRLKDRFVATLSHELRTPLAPILGWISLIQSGRLQPEQMQTAIESIDRNAHVQTHLIEDLLDLSRMTTGQLRLEIGRVDLPTTVRHVLDAVRFMADAKNITIESKVDEAIKPISGDPQRIEQILGNLLCNAVKFTPRDGRVTIRVERRDSNVEIQVSDTGQGMAPEFVPYAFEAFRQEKDGSARPHSGLGLGLAIVKQLAQLHSGKVEAFSAGIGKGTTFTVILPTKQNAASQEPPEGRQPSHNVLTGLRVLIIENDLDCREFLATAIEDYGGVAQALATAEEALQQIRAFRPNIVIVDIILPAEDGFSFMQKLRASADETIRGIPAIALTAFVTDDVRKRALAEGFQAFISKPAPAAEIVTEIAKVLHQVK
jgi:PAS domain S-box-containing protein